MTDRRSLRIYCDFNDATADEEYFILWYRNSRLLDFADRLELSPGDLVTLYQDEDDFEVAATLDYRYVGDVLGTTWIARPDWSTLVYVTGSELDGAAD